LIFAAIVIDLEPNLFQVGPFLITWHGVFSVLGIIAAVRLGGWLAPRVGIEEQSVYDLAVWMVVAGIIGARLLFVWENYHLFAGQWQRVFLLTGGGIFGGLVGAYIWCRRQGVSYARVIDLAGPANAVGFFIGRIGDVINGEHHGTASNLPWAVIYTNAHTLGQPGRSVHPEVAYEMVLTALLLICLLPFFGRMIKGFPAGVTGLIWLAAYAAGRFFLSYMREDSLILGLRQAQWAGLVMVVVAAVVIPVLFSLRRRTQSLPREVGGVPGEAGGGGS
jgi:phosphatidylglycerol:prolipoprotein diacylglycerol transferase